MKQIPKIFETVMAKQDSPEERLARMPAVLRAYAMDLRKFGKPMDSGLPSTLDFVASELVRAVNEYDALCAVAEAARILLAHHRISELRKLHSDTLDPRFDALAAALAAIRNR